MNFEDEINLLKGNLKIDPDRLDEMLVEQPQYFHMVSDMFVKAVSVKDAKYESVKEIDASLNRRIRQEMMDDGQKVTETLVSSAVQEHPEHRDAHKEYLDAKLEAETLAALKESYGQRSYMLKELVELYVSGYYSDSAAYGSVAGAEQHRERTTHNRVRGAQKR